MKATATRHHKSRNHRLAGHGQPRKAIENLGAFEAEVYPIVGSLVEYSIPKDLLQMTLFQRRKSLILSFQSVGASRMRSLVELRNEELMNEALVRASVSEYTRS